MGIGTSYTAAVFRTCPSRRIANDDGGGGGRYLNKLLNYKKDDDNSYTRALRAFHLSFSAPTE